MPHVAAVRTYLRMSSPAELRPRRVSEPGVVIQQLSPCTSGDYRVLYREVGGAWHWHDRDTWTDERLAEHLERDAVSVFVLRVHGDLAGYFELERHPGGDVEILYFGLVAKYFGRGLGAHMLTVAVEEAWRLGASSVRLNTCTLDHPAALANYRARGFTSFREEHYEQVIPEPAGENVERHGS
jgi:ribosomal protein S18 acetylase RimI-like enzyme